ncbi:MAG: metallophosphoesterase [Solirubrobacteraceae bacterium]
MTMLVQLSDPHIGASWGGHDPDAGLAAVVASVAALQPAADVILVSGDLADHASDTEYERVRELLAPLAAPIFVLPGNHDDRAALHRHFGTPGAAGSPIQYSVTDGPLRLVMIDSTRPGEAGGQLDPQRLEWLDAELAAAAEMPTVIAMHHPPLVSGLPALDGSGIPADERRALAELLQRHRQVRRIVAGHVHRTVAGQLSGCPVLAVPSTYLQAQLDLTSTELKFSAEPPGFAVHALIDGELISHVRSCSS